MRNSKGISLIVLVITVIVMIILAGAIIVSLSNSGIINRANEAVKLTDLASVQDYTSMLWADAYLEGARTEVDLGTAVANGLNEVKGINVNDYIVHTTTGGVTVEKANYVYYSTLNGAVNDVNNGTIGQNADADKASAVAGVHTSAGNTYVTLLKDTKETTIRPIVNMTINLGGHTLSSEEALCINITSSDVVIDGRLDGSTINAIKTDGTAARAIQVKETGNLSIMGGCFNTQTDGYTTMTACIYVAKGAQLNISNASIIATGTTGVVVGVVTYEDTVVNINACDIRGYSNYSGTDSASVGVVNKGELTINDCYVVGTHSGLQNEGTIYVNGGTYEGYEYGGYFFSGSSNISYVCNATIRQCEMPEGYEATANSKGVGFTVGGDYHENITVYMDNCNIYGSKQPIYLSNDTTAENNILYISNSKINSDYTSTGVNIGNDTDKLYIGKGCNFTADNTNRPTSVVATDEVYIKK